MIIRIRQFSQKIYSLRQTAIYLIDFN